jgi:hypothetical protein
MTASVAAAGTGAAIPSAVFGAFQRRPLDEHQGLASALRAAQRKRTGFLSERMGAFRAFKNTSFIHVVYFPLISS